jgi:HK97 family phage prohead protease/HK97 family phage major capsid protein
MPIKPGKDETQSDWMARCVPEMMGQDGGTKRPNDQAVAACLTMWKDAKDQKKQFGEIDTEDCPEVEDDESEDDYMDRCVAEMSDTYPDAEDDDIETVCALAYEERAAPKLVHKQHAIATVDDGMEFILSDATPDRFDDVVEPTGWVFDNFKKNPIALFNHNSDFPIGTWKNIRVENKALRANLVPAPKGTSPRIDEIRALIDAGILRATSVGFRPIEQRAREGSTRGGLLYTKAELVETSLVSIPANPNALAVAKSLKISEATQSLVFGESAITDQSRRSNRRNLLASLPAARTRATTGEHAEHKPRVRGSSMTTTLSKRIEGAQQHLVQLQDQFNELLEKLGDAQPDETQMTTQEELNKQIELAQRNLGNLQKAEAQLGRTSERTDGEGERREQPRRPFNLPAKKVNPLEYLIRQGAVAMYAHVHHLPVMQVAERFYPDEATKAFVDYAAKAATAPALTTVPGWAQELVQTVFAAFQELLLPASIFPRLSASGLSLSFGRAGKIVVPTRSRTPTIAGSFVGEGQPIPVRQGAFTSSTLTPKKMAVITSWSREMDEYSLPAIEGVLRQAIQEDTAISLDTVLIDTNPATAVRPAGIRNGVTGLTPTAGGGFNALVADLKALIGALLTATAGNIRNVVILMNPLQALSISLTQAPSVVGVFPFAAQIESGKLLMATVIVSGTVPPGMVIALDAADFVSVGSETPRFEVSDQATLHLEDTTPANITTPGAPPTVAAPVVSMFQTDSLALRLIMPMNWVLRRAGVVSWVDAVTW